MHSSAVVKSTGQMTNSMALWFDIERAKREEKRSRLVKAFSKLFKRKPKTPEGEQCQDQSNIGRYYGYSEQDWCEIPLHSLSINESAGLAKKKAGGFGSTCKKLLGEVKSAFEKEKKPKPLQQTIPASLNKAKADSDEISMAPINKVEVGEPKKEGQSNEGKQKEFQKLATEQWKADQKRMRDGTFRFPQGFTAKYQLTEIIGEGSFGFVMVAQRKRDGKDVAVKWAKRDKILPKSWIYDTELGLVPSEVYTLRQLSHPCIVKFLDYYVDCGDYVCMVTELHGTEWTWPNPRLSHERNVGLRPASQLAAMKFPADPDAPFVRRSPCDLFECIECHTLLPEQTIFRIFYQILDTMLYLHELGWVHRDLKDENIVVDEHYLVKLVDFGSATKIPTSSSDDEGLFKQFNGTLAFAAPEIIRGHWYEPLPAEVWTLGILLFTLAFKKAPFTSTEEIKGEMPAELNREDPTGLQDLIRRLLDKNYRKRIPLTSILKHPWMARCKKLYP